MPERRNPLSAVAAAALVQIGYVREWGEPGGLQLFVKYEDARAHPVALPDHESLTGADLVESLTEQGVPMAAFFAAIAEAAEDGDDSS